MFARHFLGFFIFFVASGTLWAQGPQEQTGKMESHAENKTQTRPESASFLRVGIHDKPPYAYKDETGQWHGLGVELWRNVAQMNGWQFAYHELPYEDLLPALVAERVDIVVGELLVNPRDEALIDFSQPFIESSVGVAVTARSWHPSWWHILTHTFDWTMLRVLYGFIPALVLVSLITWWLERRRRDGHFTGHPVQGLGSAFWFATVTMTTTGYGDKVPVTFWGRAVAVVWMLASLLLVTAFTASVASTVASARMGSLIRSAQDLRHYRNGILQGGLASSILEHYSAPVVAFETYEAAMQDLMQAQVDTVVGDAVSLDFLIRQSYAGQITRLPVILYTSRVAFALPAQSSLREKLNVSLLEQLHSPDWPSILDRYLGNSQLASFSTQYTPPPPRPPKPASTPSAPSISTPSPRPTP